MRRREVLVLALGAGLGGWRPGAAADAVVGRPARRGMPVYESIAAALAAAPNDDDVFRIHVGRGVRREKIVVDRPNVHLIGDGAAQSRLVHSAAAGTLDDRGQPWGTARSATLIVRAPGFRARGITIVNDFDRHAPEHATLPKRGGFGAQAVALMLDRGSDEAMLDQVELMGDQDTLFVDAGRSRFRGCRVSGRMDVIFGAGDARFDRCTVVSRRPGPGESEGCLTAASTPISQRHGLRFLDCDLIAEAGVPTGSVFLGRPWRPTRDFADGRHGDPAAVAAVAYVGCRLGAHIAAAGWTAMDYTRRDGQRVALTPDQARFAEFRSRGAGAATHPSRPLLDAAQAAMLRADD